MANTPMKPHAAVGVSAEQTALGTPSECKSNDAAEIQKRMDVIASCGMKVGVVDSIVGGVIKLTEVDSPDGRHHFIPADSVDHVDNRVHLKNNSADTISGWKASPVSCGE